MWNCPICGRQFARRQQTHSCVRTSIHSFFEGKPEKFKIWYQTIMQHLAKCGNVRVDTSLSCINLKVRSSFAALKFKQKSMDVEFILDRKEDVFPIIKVVKINKRQYAHRARIEDPEDLDNQLLSWLEESYLAGSNT